MTDREISKLVRVEFSSASNLAREWDTLKSIDRQAIAEEAGIPEMATGWSWDQLSEESRKALLAADVRLTSE